MYVVLDPAVEGKLRVTFAPLRGRMVTLLVPLRHRRATNLTRALAVASARAGVRLGSWRGVAVVDAAATFSAARLTVAVANTLALLYDVPLRYLKPGWTERTLRRDWSQRFLLTRYAAPPTITTPKLRVT